MPESRVNAPEWCSKSMYDFSVVSPESSSEAPWPLVKQALEMAFGLKAHTQMKDTRVYVLRKIAGQLAVFRTISPNCFRPVALAVSTSTNSCRTLSSWVCAYSRRNFSCAGIEKPSRSWSLLNTLAYKTACLIWSSIAVRRLPVTLDLTQLTGRIEGEQTAKGIVIALPDLLIGVTALHLGYSSGHQ